nr:cuticle protein AMP1A-like [Procambarus clarkii]
MKFVILFAVATVAFAAPQYGYSAPPKSSSEEVEFVPILKDERVHEEDGSYNLDVETGNGIVLSQSGSPDGPDGSVVKAGEYSYTAPDGTLVHVKFVADENGYQPQSDLLPVAPEFPHPIPQFVLDQIAFAAAEDAARSSEEDVAASVRSPALSYGAPQ